MIKLQSGLSSPSLVRKAYGSGGSGSNLNNTEPRKTANARNEFEEMLLQRREKIMNEKYSIGDKTPNGSGTGNSASNSNKWNNNSNTISTTNGYHYHEPLLKRSNTMDGGFGRSYSSDGSSGQTWLQLQQQKTACQEGITKSW
jgi:tensin